MASLFAAFFLDLACIVLFLRLLSEPRSVLKKLVKDVDEEKLEKMGGMTLLSLGGVKEDWGWKLAAALFSFVLLEVSIGYGVN